VKNLFKDQGTRHIQ